MVKLMGVLCGAFLSFFLLKEGEIYAGMLLLIPTYFFAIIFASTSIYGDMSKTAKEIKATVGNRNNPAAYNNMPLEERLALRAEYRRKGTQFIQGRRVGHRYKSNIKRAQQAVSATAVTSSTSLIAEVSQPFMDTEEMAEIGSNHNISDEPIELIHSSLDDVMTNPSTALPMVNGVCSVDCSGRSWGEIDTPSNDTFSSCDDSFNSFTDSSDSFSTEVGEW